MRDWTGPTAFVLAVGVSLGFAGTLIMVAGPWAPDRLSSVGTNVVATLGGAMIGAVATYLGLRSRRNGDRE